MIGLHFLKQLNNDKITLSRIYKIRLKRDYHYCLKKYGYHK